MEDKILEHLLEELKIKKSRSRFVITETKLTDEGYIIREAPIPEPIPGPAPIPPIEKPPIE